MPGIDKTALIALASAASWGGGDFCGGMSSKHVSGSFAGTMRLVMLAQGASLAVLLGVLAWQQAVSLRGLLLLRPGLWATLSAGGHSRASLSVAALSAIAAGMFGSLGSVAFFKAISRPSETGGMGAPAAVSGLLAAAIPAVVSSALEGAPGSLRLGGFAIAAAAIWLIAAGPSPENPVGTRGADLRETMGLAIFSGAAFGVYLVGLKLANPLGTLIPVTLARMGGLSLLGSILLFGRRQKMNPRWITGWRWAMGLALLDTGGNLLFLAATRIGRLDVASVLASLYPAGTILLAAWQLHERPTRRQVVGMLTALVAVVMITI